MKNNKGQTRPEKHVLITHFYKHHDGSNKENNNDNNRCDVLTDDVEFDAKHEEDSDKMMTNKRK